MMRNRFSSKLFGIIIIVAIVVVVLGAWVIPAWMADIELDIQLYRNKTVGVDFVTVNLLDWTALWAPIIPAAIVTALLIYPRKFLSILPVQSRSGRVRLASLFSVIVFIISYAISWLASDLNYGMFMAQYLQGDPSFVSFLDSFKALTIPFDPKSYDVNVLLTWKYLSLPILNSVVTALLLRMVMEIIGARVNGGYAIEFLGRLFLVVGLVLSYFYLASPLSAYDSIERTWLTILPLTMWTMLSVGTFSLAFSAVAKNYRDREEIAGAGFILTVIVVIAMVIVPCIAAAGDYFNRELRYESVVWNGRAGWETNQTRVASDLAGFRPTTMTELMSLNVSSGPEFADKIRPYDKGTSNALIESRITTPYETKGDTDIIYFNGKEYWVAPRSFYADAEAFGTAVNRHVRYTNTQGYVAMDAHEGDLLTPAECISTFGVDDSHPVYFGEDTRQDLILGIPEYTEVHGQSYNGTPDATLTGYLSSIKVLGMSTDFIGLMNQDNDFLRRTNIHDRINGMLLPYMFMDEDPYLVFDNRPTSPAHSRVYFCCPVYISIPGFTYFLTDYKRFLGWVLVNVYDGEMTFYRSPTLDEPEEISELISFAQVYVDTAIYPWQSVSNVTDGWLTEQLRYPESFFESQLRADYTYHVNDWQTWHDKSDFFDRPENGDLYFVLMDLGSGLEFVGVDLVVPTQGTTALAGMYVLRNDFGNFGDVIFYRTPPGRTLIGPNTAEQTFLTYPGISSELTTAKITGRDTGNILLYEYGDSLYYVIPIYQTETLQTLKYVGIVNGFNSSEVVWGTTPIEAFNALAALHQPPVPPVELSVTCTGPASVTTPALANISVLVQDLITDLNVPPQDVSVSMLVYSSNTTLRINNTLQTARALNDPLYTSLGTCANYSLGNWSIAPTQVRGLTAQLGMSLGNFSSRTVPYRVVVTLKANGAQFSSALRSVAFNSPNHAATNITGGGFTLGFVLPTAVVDPANATFQLTVKNDETNLGASALNAKVRFTLYSVNGSVNGTVKVAGQAATLTGTTFSGDLDIVYPGNPGLNYTIIDRSLAPQELYGIGFMVDLNMAGFTRVEMVYRMALLVSDVEVASTLLYVVVWTK